MLALLALLLSTVTNVNTSSSYACDGVQTVYSVGFPYGATTEIVATSTTPAGVATTLAITTDYTLSLASTQSIATLTLTAGSKCPNLSTLRIGRVTPLTQPLSLRTQGPYKPETHEAMYDRLTRQLQEVRGSVPSLGKGQILVGSVDGTKVFPQGSTGQVLTADSTQSVGLVWGAGTSGSTYIGSGTGAILRSIGGKLGDVISVRDYGTVGDGVADDTAAVQAALTAAAGRTLKFQSGTYLITAQMSPAANSVLECDGTCILLAGSAPFLGPALYTRVNGVVVNGLTFNGFLNVVDINGISDFTFRNNHVTGIAGANAVSGDGLGIISSCSGLRILDNIISVDTLGLVAISMHSVVDVIIRGNTITNGGILVRMLTSPTQTEMVVIADNIIEDAGKAGIKYSVETSSTAGATTQRGIIVGNTIKKWGRQVLESAITLDNNLSGGELNQNIVVSSNVMESANRATEQSYIDAYHVLGAAITGNTMRGGVRGAGINAQNSSYLTITGNLIADAAKGAGSVSGGIAFLTTNYSTVHGNTFRNPGSAGNNRPGMYAEQSQYNSIVGNLSIDETAAAMSYGIEMSTVGAIKDEFNTVMGNISKGHVTSPLTFGSFIQHQQALLNQDNGFTFATLGSGGQAPNNGTLIYCSDCVLAPVCAAGGTGAFALRRNGAWACDGVGVRPKVTLTGQVVDLAATNVYAAAPVGEYRVCATARTTTSGTGTTANLNIIWTDEGGVKTDAVGTWALNSVTVTGQINKCEYIHVNAATNIQVSVTAGTYGTSVYAISATAERLN